MILMNDRIYSVHSVNDGGNFLFWFGNKGFESELEIVELDGDEWVHELVDFVEFLVKLLLLFFRPSCKDLCFLFQIADSWDEEVVVWIGGYGWGSEWMFWRGILFKDKAELKLSDFVVFGLELLLVLK